MNDLGQDTGARDDGFGINDCALVVMATGQRAQNLRELRDLVARVDPGCIYYHFWGNLLRPRFGEREFHNDFAVWARDGLHNRKFAERLSVLDPDDFPDLEALRHELIDLIEELLDESEHVPWSRSDQQFEFIKSQIVVFDTHQRIHEPHELAAAVPNMAVSSIFYHFIDARRRTDASVDDFRAWLGPLGDQYTGLCERLADIDPYFDTLSVLRDQLARVFGDFFMGGAS